MRPACSSSPSPLPSRARRPTRTIPTARPTGSTPTASSRAWRCSPHRANSRRRILRHERLPGSGLRAERVVKLAFVVDPLDGFKIHKDTTFAIMREAAARGHAIHALQQEELAWRGGKVLGNSRRLQLTGEKPRGYRADAPALAPLAEFDAVLMRKDPPFDMEYVYSTYLLELAEAE